MPSIPFTDNYQDLSSNRGYQFKFMCQKCGNGYMSTFQSNKLGTAAAAASKWRRTTRCPSGATARCWPTTGGGSRKFSPSST